MKKLYMYGQVMATESFLLKGGFPEPDRHKELEKRYFVPGGETGCGAIVLANLGCKIKVAGTHIGKDNAEVIMNAFNSRGIDASELYYNPTFGGAVDYVLIEKVTDTRTDMGFWDEYYSRTEPWFNKPTAEGIAWADAVGLDPFFGEEGADICKELGKKYATIDSRHDSKMHKYSAIDAISHQFLRDCYPGKSIEELCAMFTDDYDGLVIFTFGADEIVYARKGQPIKRYKPRHIKPVSTLGAGDTFKAGTVYALAEGMNDDEIVAFASATAGAACESFPITLYPPEMSRINEIMAQAE